jgi:DNA-binding transcriptional ArsR family regulator
MIPRGGNTGTLKSEDLSAGQIADHFISKPSISHHLDILKRADCHFRKKGTDLSFRT